MEIAPIRVPKMRRNKNFVVEQNVDAIQWPQECSACGGPVEQTETLQLKQKFKSFGEIQVQVAGIPYCQVCVGRARRTSRVNSLVYILSFVIGIPLGILVIAQQMADTSQNRVIFCGLILLLSVLVGYAIAWLLVKLPLKVVLRGRLIEPVTAGLLEEKKSDGRQGISVAISIPNKRYADKFAQVNRMPT